MQMVAPSAARVGASSSQNGGPTVWLSLASVPRCYELDEYHRRVGFLDNRFYKIIPSMASSEQDST